MPRSAAECVKYAECRGVPRSAAECRGVPRSARSALGCRRAPRSTVKCIGVPGECEVPRGDVGCSGVTWCEQSALGQRQCARSGLERYNTTEVCRAVGVHGVQRVCGAPGRGKGVHEVGEVCRLCDSHGVVEAFWKLPDRVPLTPSRIIEYKK